MADDSPSGRLLLPRAPGAQRGPVARSPAPAPALPLSLAEALERAVEDAVLGEVLGPGLVGRARTAALAVLHRRRVRGARVECQLRSDAVAVTVLVPAGPGRVERVVLSVGTGT